MLRRFVGFLLLLFLAVLAVNWPELPYHARLADLIFIPLAIAIVAMPWPRMTWQWADLAVAAYVLGALPAIALSPDRQRSAIELVRELYLVAIYAIIAIAARQGFARAVGRGLAIGGAILSVAGLIFLGLQLVGAARVAAMGEVMPLPYIGNALRLRALTASEAMLACVLTAAVPFAIVSWRTDRKPPWLMLTAAIIVAALFTFSHALAGFFVALLLAAWPLLSQRPHLRRLAVALVVAIVLGLNFAATVSIKSIAYGGSSYADASAYHHAVDQRDITIGGATVTYNVMSYARIKQIAWRAFIASPVAGIGLDRFQSATMQAYSQGLLPQLYSEIDPHSALLGRMAECGAVGGLTLVLLWAAWAAMARDCASDVVGCAAGAALAGLIVSSLNADIMNFRFVWVLAGLLRGLHEARGMITASGRGAAAADGTR